MPLYDYICLECGNKFEKRVSLKNLEFLSVECDNCGSTKCEKLFSKVSVIYKGRGFYSTDSRETKD